MNHKPLLIVILLAAVVLPMGWAGASQPAVATAESEPNDTPATATPIGLGLTTAANDSNSDVDYFRLDLIAGQSLHIEVASDCDNYLYFELGLYDAAGNLIAVNDGYNPATATIPEVLIETTGTYTIRVTNPDDWEEELGSYTLAVFLNSTGEPVDDYTDAVPLSFGAGRDSVLDWPGDVDYYTFDGMAGELIEIRLSAPALYPYPHLRLTRQGTYWMLMESTQDSGLSTVTVILPETGRYEIFTWAPNIRCDWGLSEPTPYHIALDRFGLYVAGSTAGRVGGVSFSPSDILVRDVAGQWRMAFDGEDVQLREALAGFEWMPDGSLLLSLKEAQSLDGLGMVRPQDVVRFIPTTLGQATAGGFEWFLRGADAGLTTAGESIDALAWSSDGDLLISVTGTARVPMEGGGTLTAADESILRYRPNGKWESWFDVGDWWFPSYYRGFGNEDINGMTRLTSETRINAYNSDLYFTLQSDYRFQTDDGRVNAAKGDVLGMRWAGDRVADLQLGAHRQFLGFPKPITGLSIGPAWTP